MVARISGHERRRHREGSAGRASALAAVLLGVLGLVLVVAGTARPGTSQGSERAGNLVVTARPIAAGAVLTSADLRMQPVPAGVSAVLGLLVSEGEAVGHRVVVALPTGTPLVAALLSAAEEASPGHRAVRLRVDAASVPPALHADQLVEVMAAVVDGPAASGRVVRVATGHVVSVAAASDGGGQAGAAQSVVALDVDPMGAERLLWAQSFAKALSLLAVPAGDPGGDGPAELDGLVASDAAR